MRRLFGVLLWGALFLGGCFAGCARAVEMPVNPGATLLQEEGHWLYESPGLRVEITRRVFPDIPLVWYETDLQTSPTAELRTYLSAENRPQKNMKKPDAIARGEGLIFAQTDDFFGARLKGRRLKPGVVIRNGALLHDETYQSGKYAFPPLDAMAFFSDGTAEVFAAREYTGQQYLQMDARDVLSFGPVLLRDGEIPDKIKTGFSDREPRSAIGMIGPYHYFSIVAEGRHPGSKGCALLPIAQRMQEVGVTEALNLDGGQTAALLFLGTQLNQTGKFRVKTSPRSVTGVLGVRETGDGGR